MKGWSEGVKRGISGSSVIFRNIGLSTKSWDDTDLEEESQEERTHEQHSSLETIFIGYDIIGRYWIDNRNETAIFWGHRGVNDTSG